MRENPKKQGDTEKKPGMNRRAFLKGAGALIGASLAPKSAEAQESSERTPKKVFEKIRETIPAKLATVTLHEGEPGKPIIVGIPYIHFRDDFTLLPSAVEYTAEVAAQVDDITKRLVDFDIIDAITIESFPKWDIPLTTKEVAEYYEESVRKHDEQATGVPSDIRYALLRTCADVANRVSVYGMENPPDFIKMRAADDAVSFVHLFIYDDWFRNRLIDLSIGSPPAVPTNQAYYEYSRRTQNKIDDQEIFEVSVYFWEKIFSNNLIIDPGYMGTYQQNAYKELEQYGIVERNQSILKALATIQSPRTPPVIGVPLGQNHFREGFTPTKKIPHTSIINDALAKGWTMIEVRPTLVDTKKTE